MLQALGLGEPAMQAHHARAREALRHQRFQLRRQGDFRHQQQRLLSRLQRRSDGVQVNFGFATAGDAEQQQGPVLFQTIADLSDSSCLLSSEHRGWRDDRR